MPPLSPRRGLSLGGLGVLSCQCRATFFDWLSECVGVQVGPHRGIRLHLLDLDSVGVRIGVMANARHLPGHLPASDTPSNLELVPRDFFGDVGHERGTHGCQLIAEVLIQRLEPVWQCDDRLAGPVEDGHPIVDVLHVR